MSVSDTEGFSSEEGICLLGLILGDYRSFINPSRTPLAKEGQPEAAGATALALAMVSHGETFDRAAVLLQSTPHPSPLPKERELVMTKIPPSNLSPCTGRGTERGDHSQSQPTQDENPSLQVHALGETRGEGDHSQSQPTQIERHQLDALFESQRLDDFLARRNSHAPARR